MAADFTINKVQIDKYFIYLDEMHRGGYKVWQLGGELKNKFGICQGKAQCVIKRWGNAHLTHETHKSRVAAVCLQLQDCAGWDDSQIDDDPKETV